MRWTLILLAAGLAMLLPAAALADGGSGKTDDGDFTLRVNRDYVVGPGETLKTLVVIAADVRVEGTIRNNLVVINGDAVVLGTVEGKVTLVRGNLTLERGARVDDVQLYRSQLHEREGSTITGNVRHTGRVFFPGAAIVAGILFLAGMAVAAWVAGFGFAAVAGRQLEEAAASLTARPGQTILAAFIVAIGLPVLAVIAMVTVIGLPLGLGMLTFLLPALAFLGYIVAGAWLGRLVLGRAGRATHHPYLEVFLGLLILQVVVFVPFLGLGALVLLSLWGTGGLAYLAWRAVRSQPAARAEAPPTGDAGARQTLPV